MKDDRPTFLLDHFPAVSMSIEERMVHCKEHNHKKYCLYWYQVIDDSDVVPGWEGKIVAWVESE